MKVKMTKERICITKETKEEEKVIKQEKEPFIYGYKALDENLCASMGNGMRFEVGKTYEVEGNLKFCKNGFHFCKNLEDTLKYHCPSNELRFVKVKAYGKVLSDCRGSKLLCRKIKVVKELSEGNILKTLGLKKDTSTEVELLKKNTKSRELLAFKGFFLNTLVNDENWTVLQAVAEQGYGLNILIKDKHWRVRRAVAEQGYGLDILIHDEDGRVRQAVTKQGYGLDILLEDKDFSVRRAVAGQGYGLDTLVNDESWYVRQAVAEQGYGLDILVKDKNWYVRRAVAEQGYRLDILVYDEDWHVRCAVARENYGLDILIHDKNLSVRSVASQHLANANERK